MTDTLVLLHGLGGDSSFWTAEAESWGGDFRVLAPDLHAPAADPSVGSMADDVAALLDRERAATAHVVGFSMGGLVAQAFAVRHRDRLGRLVLASTYAVMNAQARMFLDAVRDVVQDTGSMRAVFPLVCPWLFSVGFLADPSHAAWWTAPEDDEPPAGWLAQYQAQRGFDGTAALARIAAPTLVIRGADDALVTADDAAVLAGGIAGATSRTVADAGHLVNVEEQDRWLAEVLAFLRLPGGSGDDGETSPPPS